MVLFHRMLIAVVLVANTIAFAGVDPPSRLITAVLVLALAIDLRRLPEIPRLHIFAAVVLAVLVLAQLVPLPAALRQLLQPGMAEVMHPGWAPLSLAPWASLQAASSLIVFVGLALVAARMAGTRTGLPVLLATVAAVGALLAILGLAAEAGTPEKVLLIRTNTGGGGPYGPFVNRNHFAQAIELTLPAAMVLLMAATRHLRRTGAARQRAAVTALAAVVAIAMSAAALLRCGSRGGALFLSFALIASAPWWRRYRGGRKWHWVVILVVILSLVASLAWTRLPALQERFVRLLLLEGVEGNSRLDLWHGTLSLWSRAPLPGSGLGAYRHSISLTKPATGTSVLEQAHNDWLEWGATTGAIGMAALALALIGLAIKLDPRRVRRLRFEFRYPTAGIVAVLFATALHEAIGFGLQTPLNRYLLAMWIGLFWGLTASTANSTSAADAESEEARQ